MDLPENIFYLPHFLLQYYVFSPTSGCECELYFESYHRKLSVVFSRTWPVCKTRSAAPVRFTHATTNAPSVVRRRAAGGGKRTEIYANLYFCRRRTSGELQGVEEKIKRGAEQPPSPDLQRCNIFFSFSKADFYRAAVLTGPSPPCMVGFTVTNIKRELTEFYTCCTATRVH